MLRRLAPGARSTTALSVQVLSVQTSELGVVRTSLAMRWYAPAVGLPAVLSVTPGGTRSGCRMLLMPPTSTSSDGFSRTVVPGVAWLSVAWRLASVRDAGRPAALRTSVGVPSSNPDDGFDALQIE